MKNLLIGLLVVGCFFAGRYIYFKPKFGIGTKAPNFTGELLDGNAFELDKHRAENLILLDFWGSWCPPCRQANPDLVKLYEEFHGQSFEGFSDFDIVSVSIENSKRSLDAWKRAIKTDGLNWKTHIVQTDRFSSPIAKLYGINEIPTTYLIDTKGKIVGVNMTYEALKSYLKERLSNK